MLTTLKFSREQSSIATHATATDNSPAETSPSCPTSYAGPAIQRANSDGYAKWHESNDPSTI
jgi:hypothetical protein